MVQGEFASLKEMHGVSPTFVPRPLAWGRFQNAEPEQFFLLTEFRNVGEQPPEPIEFTARLAEMHRNSISPTGKFGFHISTYHAMIPQVTHCWGEKWSKLYQKQFGLMVKLDLEQNVLWAEFKLLCDLTVEKVIPRLLEPLQSEGRTLKPCLVHGDLWDENAATDGKTGEPFVFDCASFYGKQYEYQVRYSSGNLWLILHQDIMNMISETGVHDVIGLAAKFTLVITSEIFRLRNQKKSGMRETSFILCATSFTQPSCILRAKYVKCKWSFLYGNCQYSVRLDRVFDGMTELCLKYCPEELRVGQKR